MASALFRRPAGASSVWSLPPPETNAYPRAISLALVGIGPYGSARYLRLRHVRHFFYTHGFVAPAPSRNTAWRLRWRRLAAMGPKCKTALHGSASSFA